MRTIKAVALLSIVAVLLFPITAARADGGYDEWGYNYQAHMFNGKYCDAYKDASWCQPYAEDNLIMKWNDAWLSNQDRDGNGELDRHWGYPSYIGSGAWETNHQSGVYIGDDGLSHEWTYFVKIVAMPTADYDCNQVGYQIWGEFCVVQEIYNDAYGEAHGPLFQPVAPGFGGL